MEINIMKLKERCPCGGNRVTDCDKCYVATCLSCATVAVDKPTDVKVLVFHADCRPRRFKLEVKE
tara:strand:+ start:1224 stop:1418 length:195 start_codon:yes stop_codon:yes gene_type:complete